MPAGALVRTGMLQTLVPAVTRVSAPGEPFVTTANGSRPFTVTTLYCHVPAHSGVSARTVAVAPDGSSPEVLRSSEIT
ncbi:hypothetical protein Prum_043100 [Phytohabitans rumicis]|uniref:Uncharacterized protein n=2 Tax=Phytohabitans rumicis TaxID=1076125 RepID=A0A6V8L6M6_9ACTN|nr:hypothetical protein Prum_043100 [Phytohabitans rumicis]